MWLPSGSPAQLHVKCESAGAAWGWCSQLEIIHPREDAKQLQTDPLKEKLRAVFWNRMRFQCCTSSRVLHGPILGCGFFFFFRKAYLSHFWIITKMSSISRSDIFCTETLDFSEWEILKALIRCLNRAQMKTWIAFQQACRISTVITRVSHSSSGQLFSLFITSSANSSS